MTAHTAWFPRMDMAIDFEARLNEGRDWVKNVARKGRTVTFEDDVPEGVEATPAELFMGTLELVGYFGSPPLGPVAKLNGIPAPRSY